MYGYGVKQDYAKAVFWYKKAAKQGLAVAQSNLATCYQEGQGVKQNNVQGVKWYKKAAEQGDPEAQNSIRELLLDQNNSLREAYRSYQSI